MFHVTGTAQQTQGTNITSNFRTTAPV